MQEEYLHYLWKFKHFDFTRLETTAGEKLVVHRPGIHNQHAGPDFSDALIQIGETRWAGHVEIHLKSSDWLAHRHQEDPAYEKVILHVVWIHDREIFYRDGSPVPVLELHQRTDLSNFSLLKDWQENSTSIPCAASLHRVPSIVLQGCLERMLIERLQQKTALLEQWRATLKNDWDEIAYRALMRNFGFNINQHAFTELSVRLPLKILLKHRHNPAEVEALLFGTAGLLEPNDNDDDYHRQLVSTFRPLQRKWSLATMESSQWKFMRTRPANFPTVRLAQIAAIVSHHERLFKTLTAVKSMEDCRHILSLPTHPYWEKHFRFGDYGQYRRKQPGTASASNVIINTVAPLLFFFGLYHKYEHMKDQAIHLLEITPPEKNAILARWSKAGIEAASAWESQALLQLYRNWCLPKKCLTCSIGVHILKP